MTLPQYITLLQYHSITIVYSIIFKQSVSCQKVRVYESAYTGPLNERMIANKIESEFVANDTALSDNTEENFSKESKVFEGKTVQSIKALRDHKLKLPGRNYKDGTDIEE
jgi:hypothetical protein